MTETPPHDPMDTARAAAAVIAERTGHERHDVAIVLGSGWVPAADALGETGTELKTTDLPGFLPPAVSGHSGAIRSVTVGDRQVLVFLGRTHLYEGRGVEPVVHGVRTAAAAGVSTLVLTNACGGLSPAHVVGQPVLLRDHLNLTWQSPLVGPRFVDLTEAWSKRLRRLAQEIDPTLVEGVYAQFPGPMYETPAEVKMAGLLGADLVGMSTVLEAIAARAEGLELLGISLVTNAAAGLGGENLDHHDVLAAGAAAATRMGALLRELVERLPVGDAA